MIAFLIQSEWVEWVNKWMNQSADEWHPISWAVGENPLVIGLHLIAGTVLALSFYSLCGMMSYATYKQGFISHAHKLTTLFFLSFIFLCGTIFVFREVTFFYPIYWIYGAVKFLAAVMAALTTISYITYYKRFLSEAPTAERVKELEERAASAERKAELLTEHLETWSKGVGSHIEVLKGQHRVLAIDLNKRGLPTPSDEDIHVTESDKDEVLKSLEIIKSELEVLMGKVTNYKIT